MMELLPVKLMSRDNVRSMEVDSVSSQPFPPIFGVVPASMEAVIPEYLVDSTLRGKYDSFRSVAAR
jgi:NADH dehydrogenase